MKLTERELWLVKQSYHAGKVNSNDTCSTYPVSRWLNEPVSDAGQTVEDLLTHDAPNPTPTASDIVAIVDAEIASYRKIATDNMLSGVTGCAGNIQGALIILKIKIQQAMEENNGAI